MKNQNEQEKNTNEIIEENPVKKRGRPKKENATENPRKYKTKKNKISDAELSMKIINLLSELALALLNAKGINDKEEFEIISSFASRTKELIQIIS